MISVTPNGGPMWSQPLSDMRAAALVAIDQASPIPAELSAYLIALERAYHDRLAADNREFLRATWEARQAEGQR